MIPSWIEAFDCVDFERIFDQVERAGERRSASAPGMDDA